jgi:hypothetical protein
MGIPSAAPGLKGIRNKKQHNQHTKKLKEEGDSKKALETIS